jgi:hypothetical protein
VFSVRGTRAPGDRVDRRSANPSAAALGDDREFGDAPAVVPDADQAEADDLAISLDAK